MKVGSEPKVHEQHQVDEPKEAKDAKGPEKESPKDTDQGDAFEDSKPKDPVDLGDMRSQVKSCEDAHKGEPAPAGGYDMDDPDVQRELARTEEGKRLIQDWNALKANGGIKTENHNFCVEDGGPAGAWQREGRTVQIDPKGYLTEDGFFQTVAHEVTHASQTDGLNPERDGTKANMDQFTDAQAWADHEMMNEARAEARAYDLARDRQFPASSFKDLRKAYDDALNSGKSREEAIGAILEVMKNDPKWQAERQTYANDWNDWAARSQGAQAVP
jgi:hypothetical protein